MIEVTHVETNLLDENTWNPNVVADHVMQAARESMERFGMIDPVVVRKRGRRFEIIDGAHRLRVCQELGHATVPAIVVKATDSEAKKLTVILNDIKGKHDTDLLGALLADLRLELDPDEFKLALPYTDEELTGMLDSALPPGRDTDDDVPPVPLVPDSKPGEVYELGPHRLLCGDATDPANAQILLGDEHASLLITSPPYGDARDYDGGDLTPEHLAQFIPAWSGHVDLIVVNLGLLRKDDEIVAYWDDYTMAARLAGLKLLAWNVWDRQEAGTMGQQTAMFPLHHEWLFVYGRKSSKTNRTVPNKGAGDPAGGAIRQQDGEIKMAAPSTIRDRGHLGSVLRNPPFKGRHEGIEHPAIYPVAVPEAYIRSATKPGDIVVDPFAGSGTTMIAAENTGRICRMTELSPGYCDVIRRRWEEHVAR